LHHSLHLQLVGTSPTSDRFFDLIWGVLNHSAPSSGCQRESQATGLPDTHGRSYIDLKKYLFNDHCLRFKLLEKIADIAMQAGKSLG
jgi:hypothetical protein